MAEASKIIDIITKELEKFKDDVSKIDIDKLKLNKKYKKIAKQAVNSIQLAEIDYVTECIKNEKKVLSKLESLESYLQHDVKREETKLNELSPEIKSAIQGRKNIYIQQTKSLDEKLEKLKKGYGGNQFGEKYKKYKGRMNEMVEKYLKLKESKEKSVLDGISGKVMAMQDEVRDKHFDLGGFVTIKSDENPTYAQKLMEAAKKLIKNEHKLAPEELNAKLVNLFEDYKDIKGDPKNQSINIELVNLDKVPTKETGENSLRDKINQAQKATPKKQDQNIKKDNKEHSR